MDNKCLLLTSSQERGSAALHVLMATS